MASMPKVGGGSNKSRKAQGRTNIESPGQKTDERQWEHGKEAIAYEDSFPKKAVQSPPRRTLFSICTWLGARAGTEGGTTLLWDACMLSHSILFCQRSKWFTTHLSPQSHVGLLRSPGGGGRLSDAKMTPDKVVIQFFPDNIWQTAGG